MTDRVLITMDDLETAVRTNAAFERSAFHTSMVSSLDDAVGVLRKSEPDVVVLTGALQESTAIELLGVARDNSVSTLGLVEASTGDPRGLAHRLGLTAWVGKPGDPGEGGGAPPRATGP